MKREEELSDALFVTVREQSKILIPPPQRKLPAQAVVAGVGTLPEEVLYPEEEWASGEWEPGFHIFLGSPDPVRERFPGEIWYTVERLRLSGGELEGGLSYKEIRRKLDEGDYLDLSPTPELLSVYKVFRKPYDLYLNLREKLTS